MSRFLPCLGLAALLGGCAVYPDGSLGPLPPAAPAGVYVPPPAPAVPYAPPAYAYPGGEGASVYYVPPAAPPVVVSPSIGLGFYWGPRGYWGPGYYGRPYYGRPYYGRRW